MNRKKAKPSPIETRRSNYSDINELFVDACENGDYQTVGKILEAVKDFNIDVTDNLGRSALRLAVENEHLEVVRILLNKSDTQKLREALLLAIYLGHTQIAESILKHPNYKVMNDKKFHTDNDSFWQTPSSDDAQFSPDITPLILASQYKRTEIVQMLLSDGNRITKPHAFQCKCTECSNKFKFDSLRHAQSRLNAYRGICSESYISLASLDPLQTAFELGHELKLLAEEEKYFKNEYLKLAEELSNYAVRLLNNVRGRDELEIILDKTGKEDEEKFERLARIDLAVKYEEKPFVAHSNCQQKLVEIWYSGARKISKMNQFIQNCLIILYVFLMPFFSLVYIVAPKSKIGKFMCQPCIKFVSHTISYFGFIGMIIVSSLTFAQDQANRHRFSLILPQYSQIFEQYALNNTLRYRFPTTDFYIRMGRPNNLDYAISIWIIGFLWKESVDIYQNGIKQYLLSSKNIFNLSMTVLYALSFYLRYYTIVVTLINGNKICTPEFWQMVTNLNSSNINDQIETFKTFYWLNDDRFYWQSYDPMFVSEALFAIANIFSFCGIIFILPANQSLGPLQITLGNMISVIIKFLSIFSIIFASFVIAIYNLYWSYDSNIRQVTQIITHHNTTSAAENSFSTLTSTFGTSFWSLFGLDSGKETYLQPEYDDYITQTIGGLIFGAFHITCIIILLNMLIARMTRSYEEIRFNADIEWKFARSKLYMEYIREGLVLLPPPFNLIPTANTITYIMEKIRKFKNVKRSFKDNKATASNTHNSGKNGYMTNGGTGRSNRRLSLGGDVLTYSKVVQRIIKRFLLRNHRDNEDIKEGDLSELKQDLQMIRFEVHNDLSKSRLSAVKSISLLHTGLTVVGDEIMKKSSNIYLNNKFIDFKSFENDFKEHQASEVEMKKVKI